MSAFFDLLNSSEGVRGKVGLFLKGMRKLGLFVSGNGASTL